MNLHEECLLKYLLNPLGLFNSTEMLKMNNELIEKGFAKPSVLRKASKIKFGVTRL